jgi:hypothetical protein
MSSGCGPLTKRSIYFASLLGRSCNQRESRDWFQATVRDACAVKPRVARRPVAGACSRARGPRTRLQRQTSGIECRICGNRYRTTEKQGVQSRVGRVVDVLVSDAEPEREDTAPEERPCADREQNHADARACKSPEQRPQGGREQQVEVLFDSEGPVKTVSGIRCCWPKNTR